MALTNSKSNVAIIYASVTGNTEHLAEMLHTAMVNRGIPVEIYRVEDFSLDKLLSFDRIVIGTYTWGSGEIPAEMRELYRAIEKLNNKKLKTAVFGTGDSFFAEFCGAVDRFRDMLFAKTKLVASLKVELTPQPKDVVRCEKLADLIK